MCVFYIGIDLGGTNIKAAAVTPEGEILGEASLPTALPRSAQEVCDDMIRAAQLAAANSSLEMKDAAAVGVGCPGTVDDKNGVILYSNNLNWENFQIREYLETRLNKPVAIGNDANVAALGEAMAGCAKDAQSAVIITLGTGVGGGVVLEGELLTGYTGAASEPGHIVVEPNGRLCSCGRRGCLEAYASATALIRTAQEAMEKDATSKLHFFAAQAGGVTGKVVFDAAQADDPTAQKVVEQYIHYLGLGIADLINIFFPEVIGLSGGIANQGEKLLVPLRKEVQNQVFGHAHALKKTRICACTLGYKAGVIGAAMLARQKMPAL